MKNITTIEEIKAIPIKNYLASKGYYPVKEYSTYGMYVSPFREECKPSFKVSYQANLWYDFGSNQGGSIIDLVMKIKNCSLAQAITLLEEKADFPFRVKTAFPSPAESVERIKLLRTSQILPLHLSNYIRERGISSDVAAKFLSAIYYQINGKEYSALGFKNISGGYELRNPFFKGCYPPKTISYLNQNTPTVNLFEGFMDFLSLLTLQPSENTQSALILNSITNLEKATPILSKYSEINAFLDNDDSGRTALVKLQSFGFSVNDCSHLYGAYKDLNAYLCGQRQRRNQSVNPPKRGMKR